MKFMIIYLALMFLIGASPEVRADDLKKCDYPLGLRSEFKHCDFSHKNFEGQNLSHKYFSHSSFKQARLSQANLQESSLISSDVTGADFTGADLSRAFLIDVDLSKANFKGAILSGAIVKVSDTSFEACDVPSIGKCEQQPQAGSPEEIVLQLALDFPAFRGFTKNRGAGGGRAPLALLRNEFIPANTQLTHQGLPVQLMSEEELIQQNKTNFFEITGLTIAQEGKALTYGFGFTSIKKSCSGATLEYAFPQGAQFGIFCFEQQAGRWSVKDRDVFRSSSGARARLKKFRNN